MNKILVAFLLLLISFKASFSNEEVNSGQLEIKPINVGIVPALSLNGSDPKQTVNYISYNLIYGKSYEMWGYSSALILNKTINNMFGYQSGGFYNSIAGKMIGVQSSLIYNKCNDGIGFQQSFIKNRSNLHFAGMQLAAIYNSANTMTGFQVALINRTKKIRGIQLGLLNIADEINGIPIGLVSFIGHPFIRYDVSYNDFGLLENTLYMGNKAFHTNAIVSFNTSGEHTLVLGFGFGNYYNISNDYFLQSNLSINFYGEWLQPTFEVKDYSELDKEDRGIEANMIRLNVQFGKEIFKHVCLKAGPSFKFLYNIIPYSSYGYGGDPDPAIFQELYDRTPELSNRFDMDEGDKNKFIVGFNLTLQLYLF